MVKRIEITDKDIPDAMDPFPLVCEPGPGGLEFVVITTEYDRFFLTRREARKLRNWLNKALEEGW